MHIDEKDTLWICENCNYQLSADEFEDDYVFWFCENCNDYLNNQNGYKRYAKTHICTNCGYKNNTSLNTANDTNSTYTKTYNYLGIIGKIALAAGVVYMISRCTSIQRLKER